MSDFLQVKCQCGNEQILFEKPAGEVKCNACNEAIAVPTGSKAHIIAKVLKKLE